MQKISVVINTLNEEKNIVKCLESVKGFADEIIVVDMKSDDLTVKLAKNYGAKIYEHARTGYVEPARNFAISKATGDWILVLDADETLSSKLKVKLKDIARNPTADYFRLPRKNLIFNKWIKHSRWWPDYNVRFFKRGHVEWSEIIHSVPMTTGEGLDLPTKEELAIVHNNYESIDQFVERLNRYTSRQSENMFKEGIRFDWTDLIRRPSAEFLSRYFQGEGYRDGIHGLALSLLQSFSELVLYLKLWQIEKFKDQDMNVFDAIKEMKESNKDLNYWSADLMVKMGSTIINRFKRKLKLP